MPWPKPPCGAAPTCSWSPGQPPCPLPRPRKSPASKAPRKCARRSCSNSPRPPSSSRPPPSPTIARNKTHQLVIGFAAETDNILENARKKLAGKMLDAIVVNDVSRVGTGFDSERNAVTILTQDEVVEVAETTKWEVAQRVLDQVVKLRRRHPTAVRS